MKRLELDKTPEQAQLIRDMGDDDLFVRVRARQAFAQALGPAVQTALDQTLTLSTWFRDKTFTRGERQTIKLSQYWDVNEDQYVSVWNFEVPNGLPTNHLHGVHELPFVTFPQGSAVEIDEQFIMDADTDAISNDINKMLQELLLTREFHASSILLRALAEAETTYGDKSYRHVIRTEEPGELKITDYNKLATRASRINASWVGGTPAGTVSRGFSDLAMSPEMVGQLRNLAFNPLNNKGEDTPAGGPESVRDEIYRASGAPNLYGVGVVQFNELGVGEKWNDLFGEFTGATEYDGAAFDPDEEEVILAIDRRPRAAPYGILRMVEQNGHIPTSVTVRPDDQYFTRQKKVGFWTEERNGYIVVDPRPLTGMIVGKEGS